MGACVPRHDAGDTARLVLRARVRELDNAAAPSDIGAVRGFRPAQHAHRGGRGVPAGRRCDGRMVNPRQAAAPGTNSLQNGGATQAGERQGSVANQDAEPASRGGFAGAVIAGLAAGIGTALSEGLSAAAVVAVTVLATVAGFAGGQVMNPARHRAWNAGICILLLAVAAGVYAVALPRCAPEGVTCLVGGCDPSVFMLRIATSPTAPPVVSLPTGKQPRSAITIPTSSAPSTGGCARGRHIRRTRRRSTAIFGST